MRAPSLLAFVATGMIVFACGTTDTTSPPSDDIAASTDASSSDGGSSSDDATDDLTALDTSTGDALPADGAMDAFVSSDAAAADADAGADASTDGADAHLAPDAGPCSNGIKDGNEADTDCGGSCPAKCGNLQMCAGTPDCDPGLTCIAGTCEAPNCGGSGTTQDPWKLCRASQLELVRTNPGKAFALGNDIDLAGKTFAPLESFTGVLDGAGHAIRNWTFAGSSLAGDTAFIGTFSGSLLHLTLESINLTATGYDVAGLVARIDDDAARIHDCHVTGTIDATRTFGSTIAGLVGYVQTAQVSICAPAPAGKTGLLITSSSANVTLKTSAATPLFMYAGGLVGGSGNGQLRFMIADSFALGSMAGVKASYPGGLVGGVAGGYSGLTVLRSFAAVGMPNGSGMPTGGGLAYLSGSLGSTTASFWDLQISGVTSSSGGTGVSTVLSKAASTFSNAGWSSGLWILSDGSTPATVAAPPLPARTVACDEGSLVEYEGVCPVQVDHSGVINGANCP